MFIPARESHLPPHKARSPRQSTPCWLDRLISPMCMATYQSVSDGPCVGILKTQLWQWAADEIFVAEPVPSLHACHHVCCWGQALRSLGQWSYLGSWSRWFAYLSPNHVQHSWDVLMYFQCWTCRGPILRVVFTLVINLSCFLLNVSEACAKPLVSSHESPQTYTAGLFRIVVSQAWEFFCHKKYSGEPLVCGRKTWLCGVS